LFGDCIAGWDHHTACLARVTRSPSGGRSTAHPAARVLPGAGLFASSMMLTPRWRSGPACGGPNSFQTNLSPLRGCSRPARADQPHCRHPGESRDPVTFAQHTDAAYRKTKSLGPGYRFAIPG
jgi:hypothetical protein